MKWDGGPQPSMPALRCSEEQLNAARRTVCRNAHDFEDAWLLLDMLRLLPEPNDAGPADDD